MKHIAVIADLAVAAALVINSGLLIILRYSKITLLQLYSGQLTITNQPTLYCYIVFRVKKLSTTNPLTTTKQPELQISVTSGFLIFMC